MKQKKIYLSGKWNGMSRAGASAKFGMVEKQLMNEGYEVINPLNIIEVPAHLHSTMKICLKALMDCDEVYFLPCWEESATGVVEKYVSEALKIPKHPKSK